MSRRVVWLQLLIGWFPLWALLTAVIVIAHDSSHIAAAHVAFRMVLCAAVLGIGVQRLTEHYPWQAPARVGFVMAHLALAVAYSGTWMLLNSAVESALHGALVLTVGPSGFGFLLTGVWLYVMIAGVSYTSLATERAAKAEASAAKAQLASLRAQLNPHFLFNALHSVVQLIPQEPTRAAQAAEQLAGLLRSTIEEDRELVPLGEELAFVERYLALERMRFDDRLITRIDVPDSARATELPVFALQTLVENAIRHGASPRIEATTIEIRGMLEGDTLRVSVTDDGTGASSETLAATTGSGLRRLRERLAAIYGDRAQLETHGAVRGFGATLTIRQPRGE